MALRGAGHVIGHLDRDHFAAHAQLTGRIKLDADNGFAPLDLFDLGAQRQRAVEGSGAQVVHVPEPVT